MASTNRPTQGKRNRERSLQERRQEKDDRRAVRKEQKKTRAELSEDGIDPDLIGIVPGPQEPPADED